MSASTRSAASRRVRVEIWSTMAEILGARVEEGGGGGGVEEAAAGVGAALEEEEEAKARIEVGRKVLLRGLARVSGVYGGWEGRDGDRKSVV